MKKCTEHTFKEYYKSNYQGRIVLKEVKCIYCNQPKQLT
jgi:formate hydrogenlyase subunit 6/NADH:ubiquinone oxidoreductase subunit I